MARYSSLDGQDSPSLGVLSSPQSDQLDSCQEYVMAERIFIVGHGAVTCLGRDMDSTWQGLLGGKSGLRRHPGLGGEAFLQDIAGMVDQLEPDAGTGDRTLSKLS